MTSPFMLSEFQPLDDRLLLKRLPHNPGLIELVGQEPAHHGQVVAVGPGKRGKRGGRKQMGVKRGDEVYYQSSDRDDGDFVLIQEADILVVIR